MLFIGEHIKALCVGCSQSFFFYNKSQTAINYSRLDIYTISQSYDAAQILIFLSVTNHCPTQAFVVENIGIPLTNSLSK